MQSSKSLWNDVKKNAPGPPVCIYVSSLSECVELGWPFNLALHFAHAHIPVARLSVKCGREGKSVGVVGRRGPSIFGEAGKGPVFSLMLGSACGGNQYVVGEGRVNSCGSWDGSIACDAFGKNRFSGRFRDNLGCSASCQATV